jgi:hypothetical protein
MLVQGGNFRAVLARGLPGQPPNQRHGRWWMAVSSLRCLPELCGGAQEFHLEVQAATLALHDELRNV